MVILQFCLQMYLSYLQLASIWSIIISIILIIISVILVVYDATINSFGLSNKTLFKYNIDNIYNFNRIISIISNHNNNNNDEYKYGFNNIKFLNDSGLLFGSLLNNNFNYYISDNINCKVLPQISNIYNNNSTCYNNDIMIKNMK